VAIVVRDLRPCIFIVDDDELLRDVISAILRNARFQCRGFGNGEDCLKSLTLRNCDLLLTDLRLPGKDGIEVLIEARQKVPWLPVIVITSYASIATCVRAVKAGASDFIERPVEGDVLVEAVRTALNETVPANKRRGEMLTKTEAVILHLILEGQSNKAIAVALHRSIRTIEDHRNHIMHKLSVDNVVDLVRRAGQLGLTDLSGK
jgi:two-component system response regulator FixJ